MDHEPHRSLPKFTAIRALLVDDDPFVRATTRRMLHALAVSEIGEASSGGDAMRQVAEGLRTDLIICDIAMAPMHGEAFLRRLRAVADPAVATTPVLMLTGIADFVTMRNAMRLGISGYLLKPISVRQLADHLAAIFPAGSNSRPTVQVS